MNQPRLCPHCGHSNFNTATFCAACGARLTSVGRGWKLTVSAIAVFVVGLLWAAAGYKVSTTPQAIQPHTLSTQTPSTSPLPPAPTSLGLTSAQHLAEARRALADGYAPNKDQKRAAWGEVAAARWHLKAITSGAPAYREAQELLKEVARRERQSELAAKPPSREAMPLPAVAGAQEGEGEDEEGSSYTADTSPLPATASAARQPIRSPASDRAPAASQTGGGSSGDYYTNTYGKRVRRPTFSESGPPAGASAQCWDGSYSFSQSRRGTCSHHGGVARWL